VVTILEHLVTKLESNLYVSSLKMPRYLRGILTFTIPAMSILDLYQLFLKSTGVQTDTRKIREGEMYVALKGENFNGNQFAQQALDKGASCAIVDQTDIAQTENCYLVEDGLLFLQDLATHHRKQFTIPILAITGSNGKTTTKELLAAVLSKKYTVLATEGNLNNHIGVPLTLLRINSKHSFAIIEMGANHKKEIESYCQWALPNFALINNCGKAHLEGFGGIEGVRKGKGELYDFIKKEGGTIFRNADYDYLESMSSGIENQITYGEFSGTHRGKIYEHEPFLKIAIVNSGEEQLIPTNLVGDYNLPNVLAAFTVGKHFEVSKKQIARALSEYEPTNNRSEYKVKNGVHIILDAYNANPSSMKAAIQSFSNTKHTNKTMMLGAMMELGDETAIEHENVLDEALKNQWKYLITVGKEFEEAAKNKGLIHFKNAKEAKEWYNSHINKGDWVYIKGSRLTAMEKIIED